MAILFFVLLRLSASAPIGIATFCLAGLARWAGWSTHLAWFAA
jgi:hypothetical protein